MDKVPEVLYHYTTVDALAAILESRKIRFSALTKLDDLQEEKIKDNRKFGEYVFVSSWTEEPTESIPMWNMYSKMDSGVRIQLQVLPFQEYEIVFDDLTGFLPFSQLYYEEYAILPFLQKDILFKIEYTNELYKLEPQIIIDDKKTVEIELLGLHKKNCWSFQKEFRYRIIIMPKFDINKIYSYLDNGLSIYSLPFKYYYLSIKEEAYLNMEIVMSPKISEGNRILVELLKEKYNPKMKISESILQGNIR